VSRAVLEAIGRDGVFVNISRGSVVDEAALIEALKSGKLGSAGLDVFADEPRVPDALLALDNVVVQPHVASATHRTRKAMGQLVIDNLAAHFAGKPLLTPV
jgi:lactate dehydrogenase-like 2-hydroxyacid dehydrogenase